MKKLVSCLLVGVLAVGCMGTSVFAETEGTDTGELEVVQGTFIEANDESLIDPGIPTVRGSRTPNDGFRYIFNRYSSSSNTRVSKFKELGRVQYENQSSAPVTLQYTQKNTTTATWTVGANISAETTIKAPFLAEVQAKVGGSISDSNTVSSSTTILTSTTVPARTNTRIIRYQGGVTTGGTLYWDKRSQAGSLIGTYSESAGGTVVDKNAITFQSSNY